MSSRKNYYFDNAAATPISSRVLDSMRPYFRARYFNPSSLYSSARSIKNDLENARKQVSKTIGAKPNEVVFTAGATESINLAIQGIAKVNPKGSIIVSAIEHESVLAAALAAFSKKRTKICPVDSSGIINLEKFYKMLGPDISMVSVMLANNEIGTIQPVAKIANIINKLSYRHRIILHSDAAQAGNYLPLQVDRLGVDLLTLNGSKIYGPKQSGCLYIKSGVNVAPLIYGGGQERGLRSGTENVPGSIGFAEALADTQAKRIKESKRLEELRDELITKIREIAPKAVINGHLRMRLPNNVHITLPGHNGERLIHLLDSYGIQASTGSACSANNDQPSHVLLALGLSANDANSSLRFTLGRNTTRADINFLVKTISRLLSKRTIS